MRAVRPNSGVLRGEVSCRRRDSLALGGTIAEQKNERHLYNSLSLGVNESAQDTIDDLKWDTACKS